MTEIKVFSMNCWLIPVQPYWPYIDFKVPKRVERLIELLDSLDSPDLILLQELWSPRAHAPMPTKWFARRQVEQFLSWKYPTISKVFAAGRCSCLKVFDSGLLIASKLPLHSSEFRLYSKTSYKEDILASKGALIQAFSVGKNDCIVVLTTHLDAGNDAVKFFQIDEMLDFYEEFTKNLTNVKIRSSLITGDFNLDTKVHPRLQERMEKAGFKDAYEKFPSPTAQGGQRLDYIWVKGESEFFGQKVVSEDFWRAKGEFASEKISDQTRRDTCATDHGGLSLTLRI